MESSILQKKFSAYSGYTAGGFLFCSLFYVLPEEPQAVVGICNYNVVIPAIVNHDNVWGFQFHPEKSSVWGMKVLENWVRSWKK